MGRTGMLDAHSYWVRGETMKVSDLIKALSHCRQDAEVYHGEERDAARAHLRNCRVQGAEN